MSSENHDSEQNETIVTNGLPFLPKISDENATIELNNQIKNNFMSYCFSFLQEDEESHQCVQMVWNRYLQCVGDVVMVKIKRLFIF